MCMYKSIVHIIKNAQPIVFALRKVNLLVPLVSTVNNENYADY